jgi:hypothetical protein
MDWLDRLVTTGPLLDWIGGCDFPTLKNGQVKCFDAGGYPPFASWKGGVSISTLGFSGHATREKRPFSHSVANCNPISLETVQWEEGPFLFRRLKA